jgi:hypothetical protein
MGNQKVMAIRRMVMETVILCASIAIVTASPRESAAQLPIGAGGYGSPPGGGFGTPAALQLNNPVVSPFLSLAQPGINPAIAYQTFVVPQMDLSRAVTANQQQIGDLRRTGPTPVTPDQQFRSTPLQTGHPSTFLNTFSYFPSVGLRHSTSGR